MATVDDKGKVYALSAGTAIITATAKTSGAKTQITITVTQPDVAPKEIKITSNVSSEVYLDTEIILSCEVLPKGANQEVEWTCTNQARATIDPDGYVNILKAGKITIKCTSKVDPDIKASFSFDVLDYIDPEKCKKCSLCSRNCPVQCIKGVPGKEPFVIDQSKCIKCGTCLSVCHFGAVEHK